MWRLMISPLPGGGDVWLDKPSDSCDRLPGVDGKIYNLSDYATSLVLVVVFTCNEVSSQEGHQRAR